MGTVLGTELLGGGKLLGGLIFVEKTVSDEVGLGDRRFRTKWDFGTNQGARSAGWRAGGARGPVRPHERVPPGRRRGRNHPVL